MPSLQALIDDAREIRVPLNGKPLEQCDPDEVIVLTYRPSGVNDELDKVTAELRGTGQTTRLFAETLVRVLASWNVTVPKLDARGEPVDDGTGHPVMEPAPITVATLSALGSKRLIAWNEAITRDMWPDPTTAGASANGSSADAPASS